MEKLTGLEAVTRAYDLLKDEQACRTQARILKDTLDRMKRQEMTLSIIGQFKRGKSSLSNAILGEDILPVGIVPITSAVTKVTYGGLSGKVAFENGAVIPVEIDELSKYISEQENKNNELEVASVHITCLSKFLKNGIVFVDTPGVGSFHTNNTLTATEYLKESDGVIFLLSVDSPINQIEMDFLAKSKEYAGKLYFVVNKIDLISDTELKSYLEYCRKILSQLMDVCVDDIDLVPVSAKTGEGIDKLKSMVVHDQKRLKSQIMDESAKRKLRDLIQETITQLHFFWKAMNMEYACLDEAFETMEKGCLDIYEQARKATDGYEIALNEVKLKVSELIKKLFSMDYSYFIENWEQEEQHMDRQEYEQKLHEILESIVPTMKELLLYRDENAYKVVRRIANVNLLAKRLREIERRLD